jgi:hypothetical protein
MLGLGLSLTSVAALNKGVGASSNFDWFAQDGSTFPWYNATTPTALYDVAANKTFIAWERWSGIQRVCQVDCFDHGSMAWAGSAQAGTSVMHNDDHGVPAIAQSPNGYLFVFFGPHSADLRIRASINPRDSSAWKSLASLSSQILTYPHPVFVGNDLYLFARQEIGASQKMTLVMFVASSVTSNNISFGAAQTLVDFGTDSRFYLGTVAFGPDGHIWVAGTRANFGDSYRRDVFIFRVNPANGDIKNVDGSTTVATASRPISRATSEASFRVVTTNASGIGGIPQTCFDSSDNFHLLYADGANQTSVHVYHSVWNGAAFSSAQEVFFPRNRYNGFSIRRLESGVEMLASISADETGARGGNIYRALRDAAGVYTPAALVRLMETNLPLENPNPVLNGLDELSWTFMECSGGTANSNGSVSDDTYAGFQRVFAWGSGSYRKRSSIAGLSISRNTIKSGLEIGDFVALVVSRQPRETLTLSDTSGQFALSGRTIVVASALSAGVYPIVVTSSFRGATTTLSASITVQAAGDVSDKALFRYDLDEGSGQSIIDKSGHGLSGYLGTSQLDTTADFSRVSTGLENSGASQLCATIPYSAVMNQANLHVFSVVRLLVNTGGGTIVARRNAFENEQVFIFDVTNGRLRWTQYNSAAAPAVALNPTATLSVNQWALVEAEVNGSNVTLRQDGVDVYSTTLSTAMTPNNSSYMAISAYLGTGGVLQAGLRGSIGVVHGYPRVLSSGEAASARALIKTIMSGRGVTLP